MNSKDFKDFKALLFIVSVMWIITLTGTVLGEQPKILALIPRQVHSLYAIVSMHFLHWDLKHLIANSLPLLVLGFFVCATGKARQLTMALMIFTGILTWLFARHGAHAGASGLVMGFWGFLITRAFFERSFKNILISLLTIIFYGGIVYSLLDFRAQTSFEGHLFGFIVGVLSARYLKVRH